MKGGGGPEGPKVQRSKRTQHFSKNHWWRLLFRQIPLVALIIPPKNTGGAHYFFGNHWWRSLFRQKRLVALIIPASEGYLKVPFTKGLRVP